MSDLVVNHEDRFCNGAHIILGCQTEVAMGCQTEVAMGCQTEVAMGCQTEVAMGCQTEVAMGCQTEVAMRCQTEVAMGCQTDVAMGCHRCCPPYGGSSANPHSNCTRIYGLLNICHKSLSAFQVKAASGSYGS